MISKALGALVFVGFLVWLGGCAETHSPDAQHVPDYGPHLSCGEVFRKLFEESVNPTAAAQRERRYRYAAREFNSTFRLQVSQFSHGLWKEIGSTPADAPLVIPECDWWRVTPEDELAGEQWLELIRELNAKQVPGLILPKWATDEHMRGLAAFECLRHLEMYKMGHSAQVGDAGVKHVAQLPNLEGLDLTRTEITDEGLAYLSQCENLVMLDLGFCAKITDEGLRNLTGLPNLLYLDLGYTQITDEGVRNLIGSKCLLRLKLNGTRITNEGLRHLHRIPSLISLDLAHASVTDAGMKHFEKMPALSFLEVNGTDVTDKGVNGLKKVFPNIIIEQ